MESKVKGIEWSKYIGFFVGLAISLYSLVNYFTVFVKIKHTNDDIYMAALSTAVIFLNLFFYLATVLPDKIKMKLFKGAFSATHYARNMMFLTMFCSTFFGLYYISPSRVYSSFEDIYSIKYVLLPFFLFLFYVAVYLCERTVINKMIVGVIAGIFIVSSVIAVFNGFGDTFSLYFYLPHCFFVAVITCDVSLTAKMSNLIFFKTKWFENENEGEMYLYRIFAEVIDGKKVEYYRCFDYDKYYYLIDGDDTLYNAESSKNEFSKSFAVICHKLNGENVNMYNEYL